MSGKKFSIGWTTMLAILVVTLSATSAWAGTDWREKALHTFCSQPSCTDGNGPRAGLVSDAAGDLYGTTSAGGTNDAGTVFELAPNGSGSWRETVLYNFCSQPNCPDGELPLSNLIFDAAGNLYGTTYYGGAYGGGMVFELTPTAGGGWAETALYSFCAQTNCTDGYLPYAGLAFDAAGNLYGTTTYGGSGDGGALFELTPTVGGGWTEEVLHSFCGPPDCSFNDGIMPHAGLIFDAAGNLYGTTVMGGTLGRGTVFEFTPDGSGGWTETLLYSFCISYYNCTDGQNPLAGLIFDAAGNLYGTTSAGGTGSGRFCTGCGTVFELTPTRGGGWTETVPYSFCLQTDCADGSDPVAGLIFDTMGNLYGTTLGGGAYGYGGTGTVFELTSTAGGGWAEQVLYSFNYGFGGSGPEGGVIFDAAGNLYGTTNGGGGRGGPGGTVFELTPFHPCVTCSHAVDQ